jgi:hypothetical protein
MCARPTPPPHVLFSFTGLLNARAGGDANEGDGAAGCQRGCSIWLERRGRDRERSAAQRGRAAGFWRATRPHADARQTGVIFSSYFGYFINNIL